ncbi:MAG: alkylmercury lyase family protein [Promethearchaeota archaeon]
MTSDLDSKVHYTILKYIIDTGYAPDAPELSKQLKCATKEIKDSLFRLADDHGVVLHPNNTKIWVIHPFSLWPTNFWVTSKKGSWWGNCAWCSLGIAAILKEDTRIATTIGAHNERVEIHIENGKVVESDLYVHFSIPVAQAWDNVIYYCGTVLIFQSEEQVDRWCTMHNMNKGVVLPIEKTWDLAKVWYGNHLAPDWKKWTTKEAQEIFTQLGLTDDFWKVPLSDERF